MGSAIRIRQELFAAVVAVALALAGAGCNFFKDSSPDNPVTNTETFSGTVALQGSSVFTFTVAKSGEVSLTLTSVGPTATTPVGLGIGTGTGTACTLTSSTPTATAGSSPQIKVTESPGTYCVKVYDPGTLAAAVTFSVNIAHS
jgi:hypothetical protein